MNPRATRVSTSWLAFPLAVGGLLSGCETTGTSPGTATSPPSTLVSSPPPPSPGTTPSAVPDPGGAAVPPPPTYLPAAMAEGERRFVREWRQETTPDGRSIRVAYEIEIDAQGHPLGPGKPAKW